MQITVQEKIAELEQRIVKLEARIAEYDKMDARTAAELRNPKKSDNYFAKICDVFFNGRPA